MRRLIMQALLLLSVVVLGGCHSGSASSPTPTTTTPPTAQPSSTATPTPEAVTVSDPALANQLAFAFIQANDVWISFHGAPPQPVTHLGLGIQPLNWFLLWSADQTKLFVDPGYPDGTALSAAWIISLPGNSVQSLPSSAPVIARCTSADCAWLADRYLVHPASQFYGFRVYDTQDQRDLSTSLDDQKATRMQVRGASVYFTPYALAPTSMPGIIKRFDLSSNQITTQFTVPGPLFNVNGPTGFWTLSADAHAVVENFGGGISAPCPVAACSTFYQDTAGTIAAIFPSYQSQNGSGLALFDEPSIAPDGKDTASLLGGPATEQTYGYQITDYQVVQQALPSGHEVLTALPAPSAGQAYQIVGWTAQPPGILVQQVPTGAVWGLPLTTSIYFVPLGEAGVVQLVETIVAGLVICAPPAA